MSLPALSTALACIVYAYLVLPSLTVIPISFSENFTLDPAQWSLVLYRRLFASGEWVAAIGNSAIIAACASLLALLAGVPAAYAFSRGHFRGKAAIQLVVICPLFVPVIVIALGLYFLGNAIGATGSLWMLVVAHSMYAVPFVIVLILSGLQQIDSSLEDAVMILGAKPTRIFLEVVLPQLRISIFASAIFAFLVSFDEVMIAWFISGPTTITLPVRMYSSIMWDNTPEIAAVSTLLTVFSLAVCLALVGMGADPLRKAATRTS